MDDIVYIRGILKEEILRIFGHEILYAKDCQVLSAAIQERTNRRISISTLKRLFGIIQSTHNPSRYSLDTLAIYLNYPSWADLRSSFKVYQAADSGKDYWTLLKKRIQPISKRSLASMKARLGPGFPDYQVREFAVHKFESFLQSQHTALAFIAPGGYGKTTLVTQLVEMFFTGPHARYPGDIACLVDGSILLNLLNLNLEMVRLKNVFEFEQRNSFSVYFRQNPELVRGRFVLIIDCLCQIYYQEEKLNSFVENLLDLVSAYKETPWFKLVITCKPDNWKNVSNLILRDPGLTSAWFGVQFRGSANDCINIPLLGEAEIIFFLRKKYAAKRLKKFQFLFPDTIQVLSNPYMLQVFSSSPDPKAFKTDLELLDHFVSEKILNEPYLEEKYSLADLFFRTCNFARHTSAVDKRALVASRDHSSAYKDLIYHNVFFEYAVRSSYMSVNTYVKFSSDILMEYFLANKWIQEYGLDLELLRKVYRFYEENPALQTSVLKYLIKIAFRENNTEILAGVFTIFEGKDESSVSSGMPAVNQDIINTIGVGLRRSKKARKLLIPLYAASELGQKFYFESFFDMDSLVLHSGNSIQHYLDHKHSDEAIIYGHFLKFMQFFLEEDQASCHNEYTFLQSLKISDHIEPSLAAYYYGALLIYQSVFGDKADENLLVEIQKKSDRFYEKGIQPATGIPIFEYIVLYSLNYGDCFEEIIRISNLILERYEASSSSPAWQHQLFHLIRARALLNTGEINEAFRLQKRVELQNVPVNYTYYVKLRYKLLVVEFLIFEEKRKEAKSLLKEIKNISKMIRHQYFYSKALMWEALLK